MFGCLVPEGFQQIGCCHHVVLSELPALTCFEVLAPVLDIPILVDMGGCPCSLGVDFTCLDGKREKSRSRETGHQMDRSQLQWVVAHPEMDADCADRFARLLDMHYAFGEDEPGSKRGPRPIDKRV